MSVGKGKGAAPASTRVVKNLTTNDGHAGPLCGARKRQTEGTCRKPAGWGTPHVGVGCCRLHGGNTRTQVAGAARRSTEDEARELLERLGAPEPLGDPLEELLGLAAEVRAYQRVLRERLADLREWSKDDAALIDRERAVVKLYGEALDRSHRVLSDLAKLGLDERLVRVREAHAVMIVAAFVKVLALPALGLKPELQRLARAFLAGELTPNAVSKPLAEVIDTTSDLVLSGKHLSGNQAPAAIAEPSEPLRGPENHRRVVRDTQAIRPIRGRT